MAEALTLPTDQQTVILRQLTIEDAEAYFDSVEASREHLAMFSDETNVNYPDLDSVRSSIADPKNPDRKRFGIWDSDTFVGTINITPKDEGAEIGYWLDARHTGRGYATLATGALAKWGVQDMGQDRVYAEVVEDNGASIRVLERAGFHKTSSFLGKLVFDYGSEEVDIVNSDEQLQFDGMEQFIIPEDWIPELTVEVSGIPFLRVTKFHQ